nr:DUF1376 domain-containing protein [Sphingomonas hominis]
MASDSEWRAGLTLWWAAWTQCPAASLPDDDAALCRLADLGRDVKAWKKMRERALHGFVKCSDGRLYHPVLAQQALVAWDKRQQDRTARSADADRKARERADRSRMFEKLAAVGVTPNWNIKTKELRDLVTRHVTEVAANVLPQSEDCPPDVTPPVTRTVTAKTGRDGTLVTVANAPADDPPDLSKLVFDEGVKLLTAAGKSTTSARSMVAKWAKTHGDGPVREALISAVGRAEPISWIEKRLRDRAAVEDEARALSRARAERYRQLDGPPPEVVARMQNGAFCLPEPAAA